MKQKMDTKPSERQSNEAAKKFLSDLMPNESMVDRFTAQGKGAMAISGFTYRNASLKSEHFSKYFDSMSELMENLVQKISPKN